ncbi:hypothetical protein PsYK624_078960 [Phanerochaete sordida]|uniref:Uncharacterized protein n=1 Tax=Phanerochaete sordida TaxID=48140 RepID=A0A9P3GBR6_9APHY|nr:hypothetical protein PsYK624_078960 [Phanerochaete sordida]
MHETPQAIKATSLVDCTACRQVCVNATSYAATAANGRALAYKCSLRRQPNPSSGSLSLPLFISSALVARPHSLSLTTSTTVLTRPL